MNPFKWFKTKEIKDPYPKTVAEVIDNTIKYREATDKAITEFKESKPWQGDAKDMRKKIRKLNSSLAKAYGIERPQVVFVRRFRCGSCYIPVGNLIIIEQEKTGKYSVVVFLHEFGHALGKNEKETCRWSINLFRKHFPKSYAKLVPKGHLLFLPEEDKNAAAQIGTAGSREGIDLG